MEKEIWMPVVGYEGLYEVSNYGVIVSLHYRHSNRRVALSTLNQGGYLRVQLNKNGIKKKFLLHQVVAQAFLQNPLGLTEIDHINGIKNDNRSSNLRWCTRKENMNNPNTRQKNQHFGESNHFFGKHHSKKTKMIISQKASKPVMQFSKSGEFVAEWPSMINVERSIGVRTGAISACCKQKPHYKTAGGFIWRYKG